MPPSSSAGPNCTSTYTCRTGRSSTRASSPEGAMADPSELLGRFQRASGGAPIAALLERYRAIVGPANAGVPAVEAALEALRNGRVPTPTQLAALEEAIRTLRPALLFKAGQLPELSDDGRAAFPAWGA